MSRWITDPVFYSLAFFVLFVLSVVMLITDKNLQTDFGTVTNGYYLHWYAVLVTAVVDLAGGILLVLLRTRTVYKLGVVGSGLLAAFLVGDVFTYNQVGFSSASSFANYLFGVTYFGGDVRYLYDLLLAAYIGTFLFGLISLLVTHNRQALRTPSEPSPAPPS
jgi:hypothetical protein